MDNAVIHPLARRRHVCDDRHAIRAPNTDEDAHIWCHTLLQERVSDLFRTEQGLRGHVTQIQNELNRARPGPDHAVLVTCERRIRRGVEKAMKAAPIVPNGKMVLWFPNSHDALTISASNQTKLRKPRNRAKPRKALTRPVT